MRDYEDLYYDAIYEIKQLRNKIEALEEELDVYKRVQGKNNIKQIITRDFIKYLQEKDSKGGESEQRRIIKETQ